MLTKIYFFYYVYEEKFVERNKTYFNDIYLSIHSEKKKASLVSILAKITPFVDR